MANKLLKIKTSGESLKPDFSFQLFIDLSKINYILSKFFAILKSMSDSEETLKQNDSVLKAVAELAKRFDTVEERLNKIDQQLEVIREGIVHNSARFDQLEALAHDSKSIALVTRSQLTILTEEIKQSKSLV